MSSRGQAESLYDRRQAVLLQARANGQGDHNTPATPVEERGRDLFAAAERLDLEGVVAKRAKDPYAVSTVWYKIKNRAYTQMEGRGDLFYPRRP